MAGAATAADARKRASRADRRQSSTGPFTIVSGRPAGSADDPRRRAWTAREVDARLARARADASAKHALDGAQIRVLAAGALAVGAALAVAPTLTLRLLETLAWTGFLALIAFRAAAVLVRPKEPAPPGPSRRTPPTYTVLVPLHREADVLAELVDALCALDYPSERLDIKLILEADDVVTRAAARALSPPRQFEVVVVPPGAPRTKPRALNFALALARGDYVVIYDAEDRPAPDQLFAALDAFDAGDARLACVQAPLGWYNARESWLTRQFAIEYAALFHVLLPALARWGWPLPLGGTSNHFRLAALEEAGGWDPYNVTEDADLGFRLAEMGYRSGVIGAGTSEEAVTTLTPWKRQRSRWIKGFLQTLLVRARRLDVLGRRAGPGGLASLALTMLLPVVSSLLHGPIALGVLVLAATGRLGWPAVCVLAVGYAAAGATALAGLKRSGQTDLAPAMIFMPLYWPLLTVAAGYAVLDLVRRPHHWEKTRHGVSRLKRAPAGAARPSGGAAPREAGAVRRSA